MTQLVFQQRCRHAAPASRADLFFFFQAEDGIRDRDETGVQTCALPIWKTVGAACHDGWLSWKAGSMTTGSQAPSSALQGDRGRPRSPSFPAREIPSVIGAAIALALVMHWPLIPKFGRAV